MLCWYSLLFEGSLMGLDVLCSAPFDARKLFGFALYSRCMHVETVTCRMAACSGQKRTRMLLDRRNHTLRSPF